MRKITQLVVHCTATPEGKEFTRAQINSMHMQRGFQKIGYHYLIHLDGEVSIGRPEEETGAHVAGHNANSLGIAYVGGVTSKNVPKDTRTPAQKTAMVLLLRSLLRKHPGAEILGHRDFPRVAKACPCFDVRSWWKAANTPTLVKDTKP
jgi:N-acetylmuramoyl-L-alanine amidase